MIEPPPDWRIAGTTALQQFQMPLTFTAIVASQSASAIWLNRPPRSEPYSAALLISASTRPKRSIASSTIESAEAMSVTSSVTPIAPLPGRTGGCGAVGDIAGDDARAGLTQDAGVFEAQAACGAGDQHNLVGNSHQRFSKSVSLRGAKRRSIPRPDG